MRRRNSVAEKPRAGTRGDLVRVLVTAALWATGRRSSRRAALRGSLDAAIARAVASAGGRLFGAGARDAATAAAFATGAALESLPAGAGAAAVAAATLRTPPSGALAGVALGAAVSLASKRVWPVPPAEGPAVPKVFLPDRAEASPDGRGLYVAVNTASGNGGAPTEELRRDLPRAVVEEIETNGGQELRKALDSAADAAIVLGVSGGDGSINTAAQVALDRQKALAVFPSGTLNHLAGALSIESVEDTVDAIRKGEAVGIDAATIDGHVFVNTASFGAYVELVDMREKLEKRLGKWPAVAVALVRVLRRSEPVAVEIDGRRMKVWMAFIGNCRYSPSGFAPSWRRRLDDERIDFRYVDGSAPFARTRLVLAVLTGRLASCKVYEQLVVKELRIRSLQGPLRLARDGETFLSSSDEIVVRKLPKRLAVYCPHEHAG
jgi:diacylglycerol kinase family enzyme